MQNAKVETARGLWISDVDGRVQRRQFLFRTPLCWRVEVDGHLAVVSDGERAAVPGPDGWVWTPAERTHHSGALRAMLFPAEAPLWGRPGTDQYQAESAGPGPNPGLVLVRYKALDTTEPQAPPISAFVDAGTGIIMRWTAPGSSQRFEELVLDADIPQSAFRLPQAGSPDPTFLP
ncbi:hypothetical protein [Streptomyces finlayi]|nr:hypothetical protein [Streptomyces finlayi]